MKTLIIVLLVSIAGIASGQAGERTTTASRHSSLDQNESMMSVVRLLPASLLQNYEKALPGSASANPWTRSLLFGACPWR